MDNKIFDWFQYCEYYPEYEKCKQWLERNLPSEFEKVRVDEEAGDTGEEEKKRQKRGGKGILKTKKKEEGPKQVCVSRTPRGKKKSVTVVTGLSSFGTYNNPKKIGNICHSFFVKIVWYKYSIFWLKN